jgi:hypothetical protein
MGLQLQIHSDPQEILAYAILRAERALYHARMDWTSKVETERVTHSYHKAMAVWRTSQLAQSTPDSAMLSVTTVAAEVTQKRLNHRAQMHWTKNTEPERARRTWQVGIPVRTILL